MSIFSDYKVGALDELQYFNECVKMNRQDLYEQEHMYDDDEDDEEDLCELRDGYRRWK